MHDLRIEYYNTTASDCEISPNGVEKWEIQDFGFFKFSTWYWTSLSFDAGTADDKH